MSVFEEIEMPVYESEPKKIEVRSDPEMGNKLLFKFVPSRMEIEIRQRGILYIVKMSDLQAFVAKSERTVFRVEASVEDNNGE